ncbi:MAG: hypothetical protein RL701_5783, partial [Pseudomonadota bacterium]
EGLSAVRGALLRKKRVGAASLQPSCASSIASLGHFDGEAIASGPSTPGAPRVCP